MPTIPERVAAGMAFLGEADPCWWREGTDRAIDLDRLNVAYGDACVLGQRCPVETLTAYLGCPPEEEDDSDECRYQAYAVVLSGLPRRDVEGIRTWAVALGFNRPFGGSGTEYTELTAEWRRVITELREAEAGRG
jgi:hypothetical protein